MIREQLRAHGWADDLKQYTKELVASKGEAITVDELVTEITPRARSAYMLQFAYNSSLLSITTCTYLSFKLRFCKHALTFDSSS